MEADIEEICCGCLSKDRNMKCVQDYWNDQAFCQILAFISVEISKTMKLCWECVTRLSNFMSFRSQMRQCCTALTEYSSGKKTNISSRSKLKLFLQNISIDISTLDEQKNVSYVFEDQLIKEEISQEENNPSHSVTEDYSDDNKSLIDLKSENINNVQNDILTNVKKKKKGRTKKTKQLQHYEKLNLTTEEIIKERTILQSKEEYINAMFKCDKCIITFPNKDDLTEHNMNKHALRAGWFSCDVCSRTFRSGYVAGSHRLRHSVRWRCVICGHHSTSDSLARTHYIHAHVCSESNDIAAKAYQIYEEKRSQDGEEVNETRSEEQFPCEYCNKTFRWKTSLRKHMERHRIESGHKRRPACDACKLVFTNTANLRKHVATSSKHQIQLKLRKLKETLPEVPTDPAQQAKQIETIKSNINSQKEQYPCPQCDKKFQWKGNLRRHLQSHAARANGDLVCAPCNRTFSSIATYKQHMKISRKHVSENEFKYMCSDCGKRFSNKIKMADHINWEHLKVFTHTCNECHKVFKSHTSLYLHKQVVHKLYNSEHLCDHCGKSFPNQTKLKIHMTALHSGSSPYKCNLCPAKFNWHSCLCRHQRKVHGR